MLPHVNSSLTEKWYQVSCPYNSQESGMIDVFVYVSTNLDESLELLYVGIKKNRKKIMKSYSVKFISKKDCLYLVLFNCFFRKVLKILTFDKKSGIIVISDKKQKKIWKFSNKNPICETCQID